MSINVSTRFKELILGPNSFADIFDGGRILLYAGTKPLNADLVVVEPVVAEITTGGVAWTPGGPGGLTFQQYGAWVSKNEATPWKLRVTNGGSPTWFRLVGPALDDGSASVTLPRIDGDVAADAPSDLVIPSSILTNGQMYTVHQFLYSIPPLV